MKLSLCIYLVLCGLYVGIISGKLVYSLDDEFFVDPGVTLVEYWDGWGTSVAWWADVLGGMSEDVVNEISEAFFHPDKLNLNIVRYVIGGTTPPDVEPYPCGPYRDGAASETFQDGPWLPFNWTRDGRQRKILEKAKILGANIFEAFSNSPPQWMTSSGCSKGNPGGFLLHANFQEDQADAFSEYATEVIAHFHEEWNLTFQYYEPFNEPMGLAGVGSWWGETSSQEGCNMNRDVMTATIRALYETLNRKNMTYVKITAADETEVNTAVGTAEHFYNQQVDHMISKVNVHGYWDSPGNRRDKLNIISRKSGQKIWMSEMGWAESQLPDMTQGFEIAERILADIHGMLPSAWVYWQALTEIGNWGIIGIPYRENLTIDEIQYNSGYFALLQFSHYIKKGYRIIFVNDRNSLVAYDEANRTLVIVKVHKSMIPSQQSFDLSLFKYGTSSDLNIKATRTSPTEMNAPVSLSEIQMDTTSNQLVLSLPPESITTVVLLNMNLPETISPNLIDNGDFETENLFWKPRTEGSVDMNDTSFPWKGSHSAALLEPLSAITQQLRTPSTADKQEGNRSLSLKLFLSLWASAAGPNSTVKVFLSVNSSSTLIAETTINPMLGYRQYGLGFHVPADALIDLEITRSLVSGLVYVDDVQIHYSYSLVLQTSTSKESPETNPSSGENLIEYVPMLLIALFCSTIGTTEFV